MLSSKSIILLRALSVSKFFPVRSGKLLGNKLKIHAVENVDLTVRHGEVVGLVGESGCGKSTLGKLLIKLLSPSEGIVFFDLSEEVLASYESIRNDLSNHPPANSRDPRLKERKSLEKKHSVFRLRGNKLKQFRKNTHIVFQDPNSSLNPRMMVREIVSQPLRAHHFGSRRRITERTNDLLVQCGLGLEYASRYPHELSGGQKQRVAIARSLAMSPKFIVLDEPTSALDVSVQAQILNLLKKLKNDYDFSMLFISHHLMVVRYLANRMIVMYAGQVVEEGLTEDIFTNPLHPYTVALLSAIPVPDPKSKRDRIILKGEVPNLIEPPRGCRFHTRCPQAFERCGWTANELILPLASFVISDLKNKTGKNTRVLECKILDDRRLELRFDQNFSQDELDILQNSIMEGKGERNNLSFKAIKDLFISQNQQNFTLSVNLHEWMAPTLAQARDEGHYVSCHLYTDTVLEESKVENIGHLNKISLKRQII